MRSLDEAINQFAYHPATTDTASHHAMVRDLFIELLTELWEMVPGGPEKTLAIRKIQEACMYANLAVALTVPADLTPLRKVARVLPLESLKGQEFDPGHPLGRCGDPACGSVEGWDA